MACGHISFSSREGQSLNTSDCLFARNLCLQQGLAVRA